MIKLTVRHLNILGQAESRDDGLVMRPSNLSAAAAAKVAAKLIELGLVREVRAKGDMPIWRTDENGKAFSLKILKAGRAAVQSANAEQAENGTSLESILGRGAPVVDALPVKPLVETGPAKTGSKRAIVLSLMERDQGATIEDLAAATGWLAHTTRAALSGLRKKGLAIVRGRDPEGRASVYRLETRVPVAAV